ncbi:MAG: class I SAM-dependent methyltransferase [Candidatus Sumerlaeota bacterium]
MRPLPAHEDNDYFDDAVAADRMDAADLRRRGFLADRLNALEATTDTRGRLLDIGCATGRVMEMAAAHGWQVAGVELSPSLARKAANLLPASRIYTGDIMDQQQLSPGSFDAIVILDVIEHVLDLLAFSKRVFELLTPNGVVILHTPNADGLRARMEGERWNMRIPKYHYHLPTPKGLQLLAQRAGFASVSHRTTSGTGQENGVAHIAYQLKNSVLRTLRLGNGSEAIWRRPITP